MKKIVLLVCAFFVSCTEISYDGGTRLVVEGQLVDANNSPVANHDVEIYLYGNFSASDIISVGKTNSEGRFTQIFPKPSGDIITEVFIATQQDFLEKRIYGIKPRDFIGFRYNVGVVKLPKTNQIGWIQVSIATL